MLPITAADRIHSCRGGSKRGKRHQLSVVSVDFGGTTGRRSLRPRLGTAIPGSPAIVYQRRAAARPDFECNLFTTVTLNGVDRDSLYHYILAMLGALKFFGLLVINTVVAVIGTAILTTAIGQAFHPHSLGAILWKEWSLSIGCAGVIGFGMWRTWRSRVAHWTWVLPALWFGVKFIFAIGQGPLLFKFSGEACVDGVRPVGCINWFAFSIPFVRSVFYSLGAYAASIFHNARHSGDAAVRPSIGA
jgi:hypothetical protein